MPRITKLDPVSSIKVGPKSTLLPDGTIVAPEPYEGVNITFDDGITVQVERPLTVIKIRDAWRAATTLTGAPMDGIAPGTTIAP